MHHADASLFPENSGRGVRSAGPVDLDRIYDEENDTFDEEGVNFSWDADSNISAQNDASKGQAPVPKLKINMRDTSPKDGSAPGGPVSNRSSDPRRGERSFDSMSSTGNRSIPKLRGPKRDTSPIRGRKSNSNPAVPTAQPEILSNDMLLDDLVLTETQSQSTQQQASSGPSPQAAQRSMGSRASPGAFPEGNLKVKTPTRSPMDDDKSNISIDSSPSSVKLKTEYWEKRSSGSSPGGGRMQEMPTQAVEWKQFLAKKVQAESIAAAKQHESQRRSGSDVDRDSLFDFPESEGAFPTAARSGNKQARLPPTSGRRRQDAINSRLDIDQDGRPDVPHRNRNLPKPVLLMTFRICLQFASKKKMMTRRLLRCLPKPALLQYNQQASLRGCKRVQPRLCQGMQRGRQVVMPPLSQWPIWRS